ncbi:hypothetical protein GCM10007301_45530 [Azorhizobium oxalatiphilum]|uniref:TIGR02444 family protein n=1 Tax=Azorhizobium oxalatiphilum TaxID=980631 RepID=A0A917FID9_9HYPH|nr:TIGR02444 family protein [Azorhizobium oxalatiphilum]GGF80315.1 hypothetical protein GCM10007301_45530 [Azorhizobium oxalatiphilum]
MSLIDDVMAGPLAREPLPAFALRVYGQAGVSAACLLLQERRGLDVNVLLFAAYVGAVRGLTLAAADLERVHAAVAPWHRDVVRSLRAVRKGLKTGPSPAPNRTTDALRAKVQAIEIEAELIELSELGTLAATLNGASAQGDVQARALAALRIVAGADLGAEEEQALAQIAAAAERAAG